MKKLILCSSILILFASCQKNQPSETETVTDKEKYRPGYHFTPEKNWINDPNGLVYYEGEYHLFYQYNPYANTWGHMSWGHAVSKDLLHWQHLAVALEEYPDPPTGDSTMIFSGTAVIDKNNTSKLCDGKDCMIAIYTSNLHKDNQGLTQHQSLAYSNDKGRSWKRYDKNPVLDIKRKDFRDPKVFWYEPQQKWVMVLVIPDVYKVRFYESKNLLEWKQLSEFGPLGDTTRIWECPDLYELPIETNPGKTKWVLSLSGGHPQGPKFVGMQYFVGQFDGTSFTPDDPKQPASYVDYGKDFYAGIVYNNIPKEDGRTIMIGWVNNWTYANQIPTSVWRGAMSVPRKLSLKETENGIRLIQSPINEIASLRGEEVTDSLASESSAEIELELNTERSEEVGIKLFKSVGEETIIGYRVKDQVLFLDRTKSGNVNFNPDFASIEEVKLKPMNGKIKLHIFIDQSIIEVFANDGEATISDYVFPETLTSGQAGADYNIETYSKGGSRAPVFKLWKIKSVWTN
ncbi:MAG: glycoside hydrolase family 32 protein [Bacteroidota bacterium]